MSRLALLADRDGFLTAAFGTKGLAWGSQAGIGNASLVPGSAGAVFQQASGEFTALMVEAGGILTATSLSVKSDGVAWRGTNAIGAANFVPGSAIVVVGPARNVFTALLIDRLGVLTVASFTQGTGASGWHGPESIGNGNLVPGSPITVVRAGKTAFAALMIDNEGVLNVTTLEAGGAGGAGNWREPAPLGTGGLLPGSRAIA